MYDLICCQHFLFPDLHSLSPTTLLALLSGRSPSPSILSDLKTPTKSGSPPLILPKTSDFLCRVCASPIPILPKYSSPGHLGTPKPVPVFSLVPKLQPPSVLEASKFHPPPASSPPPICLRGGLVDPITQDLVRFLTSPTPSTILSNGLGTSQ